MKKIVPLIMICLTAAFLMTACTKNSDITDYKEKAEALEKEIAALEEEIEELEADNEELKDKNSENENTGSGYEGEGYSSPQEAIEAYAVAMKAGDFDAMRSVFAIESFAENVNVEDYIERLGVYYPLSLNMGLPGNGEFTDKVNTERRNKDITDQITKQYISWASKEGTDLGMPINLNNFLSADDLLENTFDMSRLNNYPSITIGDTIAPAELSDMYFTDVNLKNLKKNADIYGADDLESVCIELDIDGEKYILTGDAVKYGDRWFMYSLGGNIGTLLNMTAYQSGLAAYDSLGNVPE